jgi:hypothetical protein
MKTYENCYKQNHENTVGKKYAFNGGLYPMHVQGREIIFF